MTLTRISNGSCHSAGTTASAYTKTLGDAASAGDVLVVCGHSNGTHAANGMIVSDSVNNANFSTILEQDETNASSHWMQTFIYKTPVDLPSGTTITFTPYALNTTSTFSLDIFRGATTTVDTGPSGASPAAATTSLTNALSPVPKAGSLVLSFATFSGGTLTAGSPITLGTTDASTGPTAVGYALGADGTTNYQSTWTSTASNSNANVLVAYLPVATGDTSLPPLQLVQTSGLPPPLMPTPTIGPPIPMYVWTSGAVDGAAGPQAHSTTLTGSLSFTGADSTLTGHGLSATLSFVGAALKRIATVKAATLGFTGAQTLRTSSSKTATVAFTGTQTRRISSGQASQLSFTGAITRQIARTLTAVVSFTGALTLRTARLLAATLSFVGVLTSQAVHVYTQALSATIGFTGALTRVVGALRVATLTFTGAQVRATAKMQSGQVSFIGALSRRVGTGFAATLTFTGVLTRRTARALAAALSFIGVLTTQAVHFFTQ